VTDQIDAHQGTGEPAYLGPLPGSDLLSKLGHELRSPLNGIVGLTNIMLIKLNGGAPGRCRCDRGTPMSS